MDCLRAIHAGLARKVGVKHMVSRRIAVRIPLQ